MENPRFRRWARFLMTMRLGHTICGLTTTAVILETEVKLAENGRGMMWGFMLGEIKTSSVLLIDDLGDWTEHHEITIGSRPARKFMQVRVSRHVLSEAAVAD